MDPNLITLRCASGCPALTASRLFIWRSGMTARAHTADSYIPSRKLAGLHGRSLPVELARRAASARPEPLHAIHITAECWPFARTGGLGEVVSTLASHHAADGLASAVMMPLYRQVADRTRDLEVACADVAVTLGERTERVNVWRSSPGDRDHDTFFIEHPVFSERRGLYGEHGEDYPDNPQRFALFCMAALTVLPQLAPDAHIVHAHDWHAALVPVYLRTAFSASVFHQRLTGVLSVHNAAFHGHASPDLLASLDLPAQLYDWRMLEWYGRVNLLKGGLAFADAVTTVSATHASELVTPMGGFGLHEAFAALGERLVGIVNGLDQAVWNPATDRELAARYTPSTLVVRHRCRTALQRTFRLAEQDDRPILAMCARLTAQKGLDLLLDSDVLTREDVQVVVLGEGEARYAEALRARAASAPERIAIHTTFSDRLEHVLLGGADILLMPSRYEPCGLAQMRAQRYGVLPVAHRVGGLADTIEDGVTGFLFDDYTPAALSAAVARALAQRNNGDGWRKMMRAAMSRDFGWARSARTYREVYRRASVGRRRCEDLNC